MKKVLALALLLTAAPASALDRWTWQDTAWEAGFLASLAIDWGQTRDLAWQNSHTHRNGRIYAAHHEGNPILGWNPSRQTVDAYFALAAASHVAVAALLPSGWRRGWQAVGIGLEVVVANRNAQMNLRVRF